MTTKANFTILICKMFRAKKDCKIFKLSKKLKGGAGVRIGGSGKERREGEGGNVI